MLSALLLALSQVAAEPATIPLGDLAGTWELIEAPRFDPSGAWPKGIENRRYVFDEKGDWYSLTADDRRSQSKPIGTVERLNAERIRFHTPEGKAPESKIRLREDQLEIIHGEHSTWVYQRVTDPARAEGPIELKSLEVLEVDQRVSSAMSFNEYLVQSKVKSSITDTRMYGVWEMVRVSGVPEEQRPEQGYYNDVLIVAAEHLCFVQRAEQNGALCADAMQQADGSIELKDDSGKAALTLKSSFNSFGQMLLADGSFVQTYTRIGTDPATAPAVPLKIAVYRD